MIQSMITYLAGFEPLQKKILLYCLESDTAALMQPIVTEMEKRRKTTEDINCETAWRCHTPKKYNNEIIMKRKMNYTLNTFIVLKEIDLAKLSIPGTNSELKKQAEIDLQMGIKSHFNVKYNWLTRSEKHGTPTGIIIRKYMIKLFMKGFYLKGNETMWARFSNYKVLDSHGFPMEVNNPSVIQDLQQAMQQRIIEYKLSILDEM
jgi:hypothetical protein